MQPYFTDPSNALDLVVLLFLPLSECFQIVNVASGGDYYLASTASWCLAIGLCCAWFNILKFFRPFQNFGPFYAILKRIVGKDIPQFFAVFLAVIIPFAVVFVLFFGAHPLTEASFANFWLSLFSMFKLAMVDFDDGTSTRMTAYHSDAS